MAEAILINPRHRRRRARRKKARGSHRRRRRARRNPFFASNPRRRRGGRRRSHARRRRRARAHRNPRLPILGSVNLNAIGAGAAGYIGTRYATGWALSLIPAQWTASLDSNIARIGVKALVGIVGLPMLARALKLRGVAGPLAIGGGMAVAIDLFETYLAKAIPIPMADYESQVLTDYETRQLTGLEGDAFGGSAFGSGAFGQS